MDLCYKHVITSPSTIWKAQMAIIAEKKMSNLQPILETGDQMIPFP